MLLGTQPESGLENSTFTCQDPSLKGWWGRAGSLGEKDPRPTLVLPPSPGVRVLLVDQWVETGGTMRGAIELVERQGGVVAGKERKGHPGWVSSPWQASLQSLHVQWQSTLETTALGNPAELLKRISAAPSTTSMFRDRLPQVARLAPFSFYATFPVVPSLSTS